MDNHNESEIERFRSPAKYVEYLFARVLISVLQRAPIALSFCVGEAVGGLCCKLMKRRRETVRENLDIVNTWLAEDPTRVVDADAFGLPVDEQVCQVFRRAGANLFCGFCFSRMNVEDLAKHIRLEGLEHLKSVLDEGNGAIALLAHMGPWEALAQLSPLFKESGVEVPFGTMYRPLNNFYLENWFLAQREATGTRFFSRRSGFHKPVDFVRAGGMLGILSDQKMREGVTVEFFGVPVKTTPIPGLFLRRSGAPAISVAARTVATCKWEIIFQHCPELTDQTLKSREEFALACNRSIERVLATSPLDGFWLHSRFKKKVRVTAS